MVVSRLLTGTAIWLPSKWCVTSATRSRKSSSTQRSDNEPQCCPVDNATSIADVDSHRHLLSPWRDVSADDHGIGDDIMVDQCLESCAPIRPPSWRRFQLRSLAHESTEQAADISVPVDSSATTGLMNKPHEPLPIYQSSPHPIARLLFPQRYCTKPTCTERSLVRSFIHKPNADR
jgi:hypothetical protein